MYNALDIANYVIAKCNGDGYSISNLQLQKILYFIQKKFLLETNEPAFLNRIEAWQFGPVVPEVYYKYCGYGAMGIFQYNNTNILTHQDKIMVDDVIATKRIVNPWDLVEETHKKGGAWDLVFKDGYGNKMPISNDLIKQYG